MEASDASIHPLSPPADRPPRCPSPEATRRHLAVIVALLAVCLCIAALLAPDSARIERLLPLVT
jgi:hypothetical protein